MLTGRFFYGWIVALGCILVTTINGGIFYTFSVFFKPVAANFNWSRNETSINYTIMLVAYAPGAFFSGKLAERYGPRRVLLLAAMLVGLGFIGCRLANNLLFMILSYTSIGLGLGATLALPTATIMRWFIKLRGTMVGLVNAGGGIGGLIFAPLANYFIAVYNWRTAYLIVGITYGVVMAIGALLLVSNPGIKKLKPFGGREPALAQDYRPQTVFTPATSLYRAFRIRTFWGIAVLYILCCLPIFFFLSHLVPYITDKGISPGVAAQGLGLIAGMQVIGPLVTGWAAGKLGWMKTLAICLFVASASVIWLLFRTGMGPFYLFVVFYGLSTGSTIALLGGATGSFFGLTGLSELLGFLLGLGVMFGAISPWLGGLIFDLTNSYFMAAVITIVVLAVAGLIALLLRPPKLPEGEH